MDYQHGKAYVYDATSQTFDEITMPPDFYGDIAAFHQKFDLVYSGRPRYLDPGIETFRVGFMAEELAEYTTDDVTVQRAIIDAAKRGTHIRPFDQPPALAKQFDGLIDLVYVALGTAYLHGFDFNEGWRRVQEANMKKVRTLRAVDSARGSIYDVIKPPGWTAPVLSDLV